MAGPTKRTSIRSASEVRRQDAGPAPIPDAARVGNLVATSLLSGRDPASGAAAEEPEAQARTMFANLRAVLEKAGATLENVAQLTVYLQDEEYRSAVNRAWLDAFPDPENRPARIVVYRDFGRERASQGAGPDRPRLYFEVSAIAVVERAWPARSDPRP